MSQRIAECNRCTEYEPRSLLKRVVGDEPYIQVLWHRLFGHGNNEHYHAGNNGNWAHRHSHETGHLESAVPHNRIRD